MPVHLGEAYLVQGSMMWRPSKGEKIIPDSFALHDAKVRARYIVRSSEWGHTRISISHNEEERCIVFANPEPRPRRL